MKNNTIIKKVSTVILIIILYLSSYAIFYNVGAITEIEYIQTANTETYMLGLDTNGDIYSGRIHSTTSKISVANNTKFDYITMTNYTNYALDKNGYFWAWGSNSKGQFGNGSTSSDKTSTPEKTITNIRFKKISVGWSDNGGQDSVYGIDINGNVWMWGAGNSASEVQTTPVQITSNRVYNDIAVGGSHILAIDSSKKLYTRGENIYGQLGNNSTVSSSEFVAIMPSKTFSQIAAGGENGDSSMAVDTSGNLYVWGRNNSVLDPMLVVGKENKILEPYLVKSGISKIYSTNNDATYYAIDTNGDVWANNFSFGHAYHLYDHYMTEDDYIGKIGKVMEGANIKNLSCADRNILVLTDNNGITYALVGGGTTFYQQTLKQGYYVVEFKDTLKRQNKIMSVRIGQSAIPPQNISSNCVQETYEYKAEEYTNIRENKVIEPTPKSYPVTLITNGGRVNSGNVTKHTYGTDTILPTDVTKQGYTFAGWYDNEELTGRATTKILGSQAEDKTYYAKWTAATYNVTLNENGGIINGETVTTYTYGTSTQLPTDVTKSGYTFAGWYTNSSLTGTSVTEISATETGDKTYYAKWTAGTNTPYTIEQYHQKVTLDGYELLGSDTHYGTTGATVQASFTGIEGFKVDMNNTINKLSGIVTADGSLVLKVYYDREIYNVNLNLNGGNLVGDNITSYTYGIEEITLPSATKQGYEFAGWYDNEELTGSPVTSIASTETGDKTFYAKWIKNVFTVTFKDGTERTETQTINKGESATAPNWTKPGYTLTWDTEFTNITNDITVNAQWEARTDTPYKVIHHFRNLDTEVEGFIDEEETKIGTTGETVTAEYKTVEGFTKNEEDSRTVKQGKVAGDGSLVLHLYYTRNTYNISYELNGGTPTSPLTSKYTYGKEIILQTNRVTKQGYEFTGWYDNEELTGSPVTSIASTETGDKTFYAKWTKNVFTVTFKDGTEREDVQTINKGGNATAPNWTKPGYTLTWDTEFTNITNDITVNAQWEARTDTPYKVIHHFRNLDTEVEGFIDEEETKTGTTGETVTAEYKTVEGFTKNEEDSRTVKQGTVAGDGSLVLHLYYTRNTYNISYELNGGTLTSPLTNKYVYGKEMILQTNRVTKRGYTFAGWYDNEELTGSPVTSIASTETGDKTFYAKWVDVEQEYYILSEVYNIDLTKSIVTKVRPETNVANFLSKIDTNGEKKLVNARGEEVTENALVGTGYKLQVTFKGEVYTYEIAVRGDIDGNGRITTTDLSIINQQILRKIELTGIKKEAADTDYNGKLTTTDLSMINQAVLRKITL